MSPMVYSFAVFYYTSKSERIIFHSSIPESSLRRLSKNSNYIRTGSQITTAEQDHSSQPTRQEELSESGVSRGDGRGENKRIQLYHITSFRLPASTEMRPRKLLLQLRARVFGDRAASTLPSWERTVRSGCVAVLDLLARGDREATQELRRISTSIRI